MYYNMSLEVRENERSIASFSMKIGKEYFCGVVNDMVCFNE
jgi:hypothetical protein